MGAVAFVVPQPVAHSDGYVVVVMEPLPVGELSAESGVVGLDDPVLPGAARIDVDGLDAVGGLELLDGLSDELLSAVVTVFLSSHRPAFSGSTKGSSLDAITVFSPNRSARNSLAFARSAGLG